jgi:hypothetical protein
MTKIIKPLQSLKMTRMERRARRSKYIQTQAAITLDRDLGYCIFCWFNDNRIVIADDIHHFYGRGRDENDWREHYTSLGCVCRKHHPGPIKVVGKHPELEEVLEKANRHPINRRFLSEVNHNFHGHD